MKFLLAVLVIALGPTFHVIGGHALAKSSKQTIAGTWRLLAYEDHVDSSPVEYPFGKKPVDLLIYDATGNMAIQI